MGKIRKQQPVKLFIGLIYNQSSVLEKVKACLKKKFAEIDFESAPIAFAQTDYYEKEFGKNLVKKIISFKKLINPAGLDKIKIFTNKIEEKFSQNQNREVNIDPGYLDLAKLILATTKDFSHRIYLNRGIYAEVTLCYQDKMFRPFVWTYPDYKTSEYNSIFSIIRETYAGQIKNLVK